MVRRCHDAVRDDEECKLVAVRLIRHRLTLVVSFSVSVDNVWAILTSSVSTVPTGFGADVTMDCPRQGLRLGTTVSLHGRCNDDDKNEFIMFILSIKMRCIGTRAVHRHR